MGGDEAQAKWRETRQPNELLLVTNLKHWFIILIGGVLNTLHRGGCTNTLRRNIGYSGAHFVSIRYIIVLFLPSPCLAELLDELLAHEWHESHV